MAAQFFDLVDDLDQDPPKRDAIEQGADFDWHVEYAGGDVAGTAPGDWLARMQVRRKPADKDTTDPLADLDSATKGGIAVDVAAGAVSMDVHLDDAATALLPIGAGWVYDVELVRLADQYVRRVVEGAVEVRGEVTR